MCVCVVFAVSCIFTVSDLNVATFSGGWGSKQNWLWESWVSQPDSGGCFWSIRQVLKVLRFPKLETGAPSFRTSAPLRAACGKSGQKSHFALVDGL